MSSGSTNLQFSGYNLQKNQVLTVWKHKSTKKEHKSCWVLGNKLRESTMVCFVCFSNRIRMSTERWRSKDHRYVTTWPLTPPQLFSLLPYTALSSPPHLQESCTFFISLLCLKYSSRLLLGKMRNRTPCSTQYRHFLGRGMPLHNRTWYSQVWVIEVGRNNQGEAGLIMVSIEETKSFSIVIK